MDNNIKSLESRLYAAMYAMAKAERKMDRATSETALKRYSLQFTQWADTCHKLRVKLRTAMGGGINQNQ